jgi:phosphoribosylamine--glycine ligase
MAAIRKEGIDFRGILYIGLIWTNHGPSIIEFNVRGGDPETQVLLPLLDTPLIDLLQAVRERRLGKVDLKLKARHAVTVVMAAAGYPGTPEAGAEITGLAEEIPGTMVFHAGTKLAGGKVVAAGGRVLSVTGWASDLAAARELAYRRVAKIHFAGCQYRRDIAARLTLE